MKLRCEHEFTGQMRCSRCDSCRECCKCGEREPRPKPLTLPNEHGKNYGRQKALERYTRWWVGKRCRMAMSMPDAPFKLVTSVKVLGAPSFIIGEAWLVFDDGTEEGIPTPLEAYAPRKKDVEVENEKSCRDSE